LLRHLGVDDKVGAMPIDADHLSAVEQQHQAHGIEPPIGCIGIATEQVEIAPSAAYSLVAQRSMKRPAASTMRRHRSGENPVGADIEDSAA
jgi:hypothetical protein